MASTSNVAQDMSIIGATAIVAIILTISASVYLLIGFLRGIVDNPAGVAPTFECTAWLTRRQQSYLGGVPAPINPATGVAYTVCEAASQAVGDAQHPAAGAACPARRTPPDAERQSPYRYYMASQGCSGA